MLSVLQVSCLLSSSLRYALCTLVAFYLLIETIFLSAFCYPGEVLDPGTIPDLQYNQPCKVIYGKPLIMGCHIRKGTSEVTKSNTLSTNETARPGQALTLNQAVCCLIQSRYPRFPRRLRCDPYSQCSNSSEGDKNLSTSPECCNQQLKCNGENERAKLKGSEKASYWDNP